MELGAYLDRIGFQGTPRPDRATLDEIQRRHLLSIPYETFDVLFGRPLTTDPAAAYDKIVRRRRGGWCYEMNGLMGWALAEIGFEVTRLAGAVMRSVMGDEAEGNHLVLRVDLPEGAVLADVGLGDGPFDPFDLREGAFVARGAAHRLEAVEDGWWRLHSPDWCRPPNFDVHPQGKDEALLSRRCAFLQGDPASMFVQNLICQAFLPDGRHADLVNRALRVYGPGGADQSERLIEDADDLDRTLRTLFGLNLPEAAAFWPRLCAQHEARLAAIAARAAEGVATV